MCWISLNASWADSRVQRSREPAELCDRFHTDREVAALPAEAVVNSRLPRASPRPEPLAAVGHPSANPMSAHALPLPALSQRQIVLSRVVEAPADVVFRAFTDPDHVVHWWGPFGFTNTIHEMDIRPGGIWRLTMHGPDGTDYPNLSQFTDVTPGRRLAFSHGSGRAADPSFDAEITFAQEAGGTHVTLCQTHPTAEQAREIGKYAIEGGHQTLTRLAGYVGTMRESIPAAVLEGATSASEADFVITRVLPAKREAVFRALTEPLQMEKWFGPPAATVHVVASDLRPGGQLRYAMPPNSYGRFVYREVTAPKRLAYVVSFADESFQPVRHPMSNTWPLEVLAIATLTELDGKTVLFSRSLPIHASDTDVRTFRAGHAGMVQGWKGAYDRFDQYLARQD
jgi:uncharacterized protein YndB with AHSA1/START domain